jgi:hypothetical protein
VAAFHLPTIATDKDDYAGIRLLQRQLQEVVSVAGNDEQAVGEGVGKRFAVVCSDRQDVPQLYDFVTLPAENAGDFRRHIVVEKKSHTSSGGLI